jgi:hypothetical protein
LRYEVDAHGETEGVGIESSPVREDYRLCRGGERKKEKGENKEEKE